VDDRSDEAVHLVAGDRLGERIGRGGGTTDDVPSGLDPARVPRLRTHHVDRPGRAMVSSHVLIEARSGE
jgi:hypothetical protein